MQILLPHQLVQHQLNEFFDKQVRSRYFRGLEFAGPVGDPG